MEELEQELRQRTNVDTLIGTKIQTIEEGKELLAVIEQHSHALLNEMVEKDLNNAEQKCYTDVRYDLKTAKQRIGAQLTTMVKLRMKNRKPTL